MAAKKTGPEKVPYKAKLEELSEAHVLGSFVLPAVLDLAKHGNKAEKKVAEKILLMAGSACDEMLWRGHLRKALDSIKL